MQQSCCEGSRALLSKRGKHVITTQTEHKCVLDSCRSLEQEGYEVTYLPVMHSTGRVDMDQLKAAIRVDMILISIGPPLRRESGMGIHWCLSTHAQKCLESSDQVRQADGSSNSLRISIHRARSKALHVHVAQQQFDWIYTVLYNRHQRLCV